MTDAMLFGEALGLLMADEAGALGTVQRFTRATAGAETNVAIGLARLGYQVRWRSRVGKDSTGQFLLARIAAEGVDCSGVTEQSDAPTGWMMKALTSDGSDPAIEYQRRGSAASRMGPADLAANDMRQVRLYHATGVFAALSPGCFELARAALDAARHAGCGITFDPNLRPQLWASESVMRDSLLALASRARIVLPGHAEASLLTGYSEPVSQARALLDQGAELVVIKLGEQGAYAEGRWQDNEVAIHVPAQPVAKVIDTVGAGDAFAVGICSAWLDGLPLERALRRACWLGARAVMHRGDTEGLPSRSILQHWEDSDHG